MKVCPHCSFNNDECFPTCVYCNKPLTDVPVTLAEDPEHPEHAKRAHHLERYEITRRQERWAGILYSLAIAASAFVVGLVYEPLPLVIYALTAGIVAYGISRDWWGQFSASFIQGIFSLSLIIFFGPIHIFCLFMLSGHIIGAGFLWHWADLIHSTTR